MKVYFTATPRGKEIFKKNYHKIYQCIEKLGYTHLDKLIFEPSTRKFYEKLEIGGHRAYVDFFNRTMSNLIKADINAFECSLPSLGTGFQVEKSLEFGKPTIVFYLKKHIPHYLAGTNDEKLILQEYTEDNLIKTVEGAFKIAKQNVDKRFNFFISPGLLSYLNKAAKEKGMTKSYFIRELILNYKKKTESSSTNA